MMVAVAVLFAATLLGVKLSGTDYAFWLGAWVRLGSSLVSGIAVLVFWKRLRLNRRLVGALLRRYVSWETLVVMVSYLDFVFLAMAFRYAEPYVVAVAYEMWPLLLITVVGWLGGGRYRKVGLWEYAGIVISMVGIYVAVSAGNGVGITWLFDGFRGSGFMMLKGLGLPLLAGLVTGFTGFSWVLCSKAHGSRDVQACNIDGAGVGAMLLVFLWFSNILTALECAVLGVIFEGVGAMSVSGNLLLYGFALGGLGYGVAAVLWRLATSVSDNSGIHAVCNLTPVVALLGFLILGFLGTVDHTMLWLGTVLVVLGNVGVVLRGYAEAGLFGAWRRLRARLGVTFPT